MSVTLGSKSTRRHGYSFKLCVGAQGLKKKKKSDLLCLGSLSKVRHQQAKLMPDRCVWIFWQTDRCTKDNDTKASSFVFCWHFVRQHSSSQTCLPILLSHCCKLSFGFHRANIMLNRINTANNSFFFVLNCVSGQIHNKGGGGMGYKRLGIEVISVSGRWM